MSEVARRGVENIVSKLYTVFIVRLHYFIHNLYLYSGESCLVCISKDIVQAGHNDLILLVEL